MSLNMKNVVIASVVAVVTVHAGKPAVFKNGSATSSNLCSDPKNTYADGQAIMKPKNAAGQTMPMNDQYFLIMSNHYEKELAHGAIGEDTHEKFRGLGLVHKSLLTNMGCPLDAPEKLFVDLRCRNDSEGYFCSKDLAGFDMCQFSIATPAHEIPNAPAIGFLSQYGMTVLSKSYDAIDHESCCKYDRVFEQSLQEKFDDWRLHGYCKHGCVESLDVCKAKYREFLDGDQTYQKCKNDYEPQFLDQSQCTLKRTSP